MPAVLSKELDLESVRLTVRNLFTPFGHQCRRCKQPLKLSDVNTHNFHLRCPKCYTTMWCIRDGCGLCVYELGRPFVNKADVRTVPVPTETSPNEGGKKKKSKKQRRKRVEEKKEEKEEEKEEN
ncbi:uncharacterized protein LOC144873553 [Branchiostoma floridae x Branchiostoma japonicum]